MPATFDAPAGEHEAEAERRREEARIELACRRLALETDLSFALHERAAAIAEAQRANYRARLLRVDLEALERDAAKLS